MRWVCLESAGTPMDGEPLPWPSEAATRAARSSGVRRPVGASATAVAVAVPPPEDPRFSLKLASAAWLVSAATGPISSAGLLARTNAALALARAMRSDLPSPIRRS